MQKGLKEQLFPDYKNRLWQRYNEMYNVVNPQYNVPFCAKDLRTLILSDFEPNQVCTACLPLPFHSKPMWPYKSKDVKSAWSLACYYCPVCEHIVSETRPPWRVCIQFIVGKRRDGRYGFSWIVRLLCETCSPPDGNASAYPNILHGRADLAPIVQPVLKEFDDRWSGSICVVCEQELQKHVSDGLPVCEDVECLQTLPVINSMMGGGDYAQSLVDISPMDRLKNLIDYFAKSKVDICSPMRWNVCHRNGCIYMAKHMYTCNCCKRVAYCSQACRDFAQPLHQQGCHSFLSVWNREHLIFL